MPKLYKSLTTDIRRTGIIKRHNNDNTNKKVKNTEKNKVNTKNENKLDHKHKIRNANGNSNDNDKKSNELNINGTIKERLMKLESKFNILIGTSEIKKVYKSQVTQI